jgi:putative transposase
LGKEIFMSGTRRKRHTPKQITAKLREADAMIASGATVGQICQKLEISEASYHNWRKRFGNMKGSEAKRLTDLEKENARLKRLLADAELDKSILREAMRLYEEGNE